MEDTLEYAVYVMNDEDSWFPISYGDSEEECLLWVSEHSKTPFLKGQTIVVGHIYEVTL